MAVVASLRRSSSRRSVAVIGASRRRGSIGGELFRNMLDRGLRRRRVPGQPRGEPVAGVRAYTSIEEIPDAVDLAVICLPGEHGARRGARLRCGTACARCASSRPASPRRARRARSARSELLALVRAHGARLVGPNCLGIAVAGHRPERNLRAARAPARPDRLLVPERRARARAAREGGRARPRVLPFVSIGNKADVSSNDLLEWWEDDAATDLVLLYLESFGNPRKFARVARRVARRKPILALKAGATRPGARAASSHTAALAGSDAAVDALFHQAGVLRARHARGARRRRGAALAAAAAARPPRRRDHERRRPRHPLRRRVRGAGLELPDARPTRRALRSRPCSRARRASRTRSTCSARRPRRRTRRRSRIVLADPNVDALIVLFVPPVVAGAEDVAAAIAQPSSRSQRDEAGGRRRRQRRGRRPACCASRVAGRGASPTPSRPRARSASPRSAPSGCAGPPAPCPSSTASTAHAAAASSTGRSRADDGWLEPAQARALLDGLRHPARRRARRATRRRGGRRGARARLPRRRQDGRAGRPQDRDAAASHSTSRRRRGARGRRADRRAGDRPADAHGRRRAARGRRAGSGLRPARRLRARRRASPS